jgi:wyosine [tRNA(Phe)-imidazoG37] synthetase (radical SAM superfamily)
MILEARPLTFEDHRRAMAGLRYVYPVLSRRAKGISIGVNLNPDKACNFDCVYCQVDRAIPGFKGIDLQALRDELNLLLTWVADGTLFQHPPFDSVSGSMRRVNDVCIAGDGEPTAVPEFKDTVQLVVDLKRRLELDALKIIVITNATMLHKPRVRAALELMDRSNGEVWAKLDAGTEAYYRRICVTNVPFARILKNLEEAARARPLVIQSLFLEIDGSGPSEAELAAYIGRLRHLLDTGGKLKLIQVYSVARRPPGSDVFSLSDVEIDRIVAKVSAALPVPVEGYYGSPQYMRPAGGAHR